MASVDGELYLLATATGEVKAKAKLHLDPNQVSKNEGEGTSTLTLNVEGKIEVNAKVWIVKIAAGAIVGAECGFGVSAKVHPDNAFIDWAFLFNGLVVYWSVYYDAEFNDKDVNSSREDKKKKPKSKSAKNKYGAGKEDPFVLIDKFQIPKAVDTKDDAKASDVVNYKQTTSIQDLVFGKDNDINEVNIESIENSAASTGSSMWLKDK
ncbi:hypothetical protein LO80_01465 [Candidatus Francisella endociliophora]|uniref:Uncharacterized protein n=1 Tax=Candidatus Francisella endociliophora TaxID=653937 RepID=A0A097EMJ8_9GAMM|nr:hypothetical protein [Francisella sp. FSC1006]AIT08773.1 hypothetical protein LO80_01465 [Francisella sp. FSC1006]